MGQGPERRVRGGQSSALYGIELQGSCAWSLCCGLFVTSGVSVSLLSWLYALINCYSSLAVLVSSKVSLWLSSDRSTELFVHVCIHQAYILVGDLLSCCYGGRLHVRKDS